MTGAKKCDMAATLNVDMACDWLCQVELPMEGIHIRFTLGQSLAVVERAHEAAHAADLVRVFQYEGRVIVRPGVLGGAA